MAEKKQLRNTADGIRSAIFSSSNFDTKIIEMFGMEVEVRQPSVGQLMSLTDGSDTSRNAAVNAMIEFCYVPGTNDKVFEVTDYDSLLGLPMGPWFVAFQEVWAELASIDVGEAEGN